MKVLKKAVIPPIDCQYCHSVFQPKWKEMLKGSGFHIKDMIFCPICGGSNFIRFEGTNNG